MTMSTSDSETGPVETPHQYIWLNSSTIEYNISISLRAYMHTYVCVCTDVTIDDWYLVSELG